MLSISPESKLKPYSGNFSRETTGVVFSPYVKNREKDGTILDWKKYSIADVEFMLSLVATKFRHVTTYSMGAGRKCAQST